MQLYLSLIFAFSFLPLLVWCQSVHDDWTAPAAPDGSTSLQSGSKFTLLWKPGLQYHFDTACPSCNINKLDLWITNLNGTKYISKIGRGIDLSTTTSYDWNVNIASNAFSENDIWVFRFTSFDSVDPYTQHISSPGFKISGLVNALGTDVVQPSSKTRSYSSQILSSSSTPQLPNQAAVPSSPSARKTWIFGVVIGPLVGIALGAALMWFCLHRRKSKDGQHNQANPGYAQSGYYTPYPLDQNPKESYLQIADQDQCIVEAPGCADPVELWQGNYASRS
ncbi:hypothetical protein IQ07DRAFT_510411 [Pyrenochaeta sp. DS3sAY3a]|nr:hypothetical protein IQ07DRAFT_510411 [Pyrenochaeta sp. DS3sAY3a]